MSNPDGTENVQLVTSGNDFNCDFINCASGGGSNFFGIMRLLLHDRDVARHDHNLLIVAKKNSEFSNES